MAAKIEIAKLSLEQQEILARLELSKARHREKILNKARGLDWQSRYFPLYLFSVFLLFITLYYFNVFHIQEKPFILYLPLGMGCIFSLIFHIARTNRRMDALLELLDLDRENPETHKLPEDKSAN